MSNRDKTFTLDPLMLMDLSTKLSHDGPLLEHRSFAKAGMCSIMDCNRIAPLPYMPAIWVSESVVSC